MWVVIEVLLSWMQQTKVLLNWCQYLMSCTSLACLSNHEPSARRSLPFVLAAVFLQSLSLYTALFRYRSLPLSPGDTLWCPVSYWPLWRQLPASAWRTTECLACYKTPLCLTPWYGFVSSFGFVCAWLLSAFTRVTLHLRSLNGSWDQNSVCTAWRGRGEKWFVLWHFVISLSDAFQSVALLFVSVSHYFCSFIFLFLFHSHSMPLPLQFFLLSSAVLLFPPFLLSHIL
jgi:hypothetical protein